MSEKPSPSPSAVPVPRVVTMTCKRCGKHEDIPEHPMPPIHWCWDCSRELAAEWADRRIKEPESEPRPAPPPRETGWNETHRETLESFEEGTEAPIDVAIRAALAELSRLQQALQDCRDTAELSNTIASPAAPAEEPTR